VILHGNMSVKGAMGNICYFPNCL